MKSKDFIKAKQEEILKLELELAGEIAKLNRTINKNDLNQIVLRMQKLQDRIGEIKEHVTTITELEEGIKLKDVVKKYEKAYKNNNSEELEKFKIFFTSPDVILSDDQDIQNKIKITQNIISYLQDKEFFKNKKDYLLLSEKREKLNQDISKINELFKNNIELVNKIQNDQNKIAELNNKITSETDEKNRLISANNKISKKVTLSEERKALLAKTQDNKIRKISKIKKETDDLEQKVLDLKKQNSLEERKILSKLFSNHKDKLQALKADQEKYLNKITNKQKSIENLNQQSSQHEDEIETLSEQIYNLKNQRDDNNETISNIQTKIDDYSAQIKKLTETLERSQKRIVEFNEKIVPDLSADLNKYQIELENTKNTFNDLKTKLLNKDIELNNLHRYLAILQINKLNDFIFTFNQSLNTQANLKKRLQSSIYADVSVDIIKETHNEEKKESKVIKLIDDEIQSIIDENKKAKRKVDYFTLKDYNKTKF